MSRPHNLKTEPRKLHYINTNRYADKPPTQCQIPWCRTSRPISQLRKLKVGKGKTLLVCKFHMECYGGNTDRLRWLMDRKQWNPIILMKGTKGVRR